MSETTENFDWDDTILPFQLDVSNIRGRIVRLDGLLNTIIQQHDYPLEVSAILAEAVVLTVLIGQSIKLRWKLSLQIRGNGPIRILATDYIAPSAEGTPAQIRAYASFDKERLANETGTTFDKIGKGAFGILIDQGQDMKPYQGITPLTGGSLAACARTYFEQSEQLPTEFAISIGQSSSTHEKDAWRAGGIMIQKLPATSTDDAVSNHENISDFMSPTSDEAQQKEDWNRAVIHLQTVEDTELVGPYVTPEKLLTRLYHEEQPRIYPVQPVKFGCTCNPDKVRFTMSMYSAKDIQKMTAENGMVTADCQFCGTHYQLDPATLGFDAQT